MKTELTFGNLMEQAHVIGSWEIRKANLSNLPIVGIELILEGIKFETTWDEENGYTTRQKGWLK